LEGLPGELSDLSLVAVGQSNDDESVTCAACVRACVGCVYLCTAHGRKYWPILARIEQDVARPCPARCVMLRCLAFSCQTSLGTHAPLYTANRGTIRAVSLMAVVRRFVHWAWGEQNSQCHRLKTHLFGHYAAFVIWNGRLFICELTN